MRPTLAGGDLLFLKGVDPRTLRKGDIIAVNVPEEAQQKYNLSGTIVHRILRVEKRDSGLVFHTKGDSNAEEDGFLTYPNDVTGEMVAHVPALGYPFLFFRSSQGKIFLATAALIAILYFVLGFIEERRIVVEGTATTMQTVLKETQELRSAIAAVQDMGARPTSRAAPPTEAGSDRIESLADEVRSSRDETSSVMRELVGAIGEYGEHLRSHTDVMKNLAATTLELRRAAEELQLSRDDARVTGYRRRVDSRPHGGPIGAEPRVPSARRLPPVDYPGFADPEPRALAPILRRHERLDLLLAHVSESVEQQSRARAKLREEVDG